MDTVSRNALNGVSIYGFVRVALTCQWYIYDNDQTVKDDR